MRRLIWRLNSLLALYIDTNRIHGEHVISDKKMHRRLTISVNEQVQEGPGSLKDNLELGYKNMAADERREVEAMEWAEATIEDVRNEMT